MATEYGKTFREFCNGNLNQPGTTIRVGSTDFLIGDCNILGGMCDCCGFDKDKDVVESYSKGDE